MPRATASSWKVPSRWLIQSRFGCPSLATKMSGQLSPLKSAQTTPKPGPGSRPNPAFSVTSSKQTAAGPAVVAKGAVAVVQEEFQATVLRDEHVRPAIVVDIADCNTQAEARDVQAGTL